MSQHGKQGKMISGLVALGLLAMLVVIFIALQKPESAGTPTKYADPHASQSPEESHSEGERNCEFLYIKYSDEKAVNLTMRQLRAIETCQALGWYHD